MADLILTGATRGIGRALALTLATQPDTRLVLLARNQAGLDATVAAVRERGGRALGLVCDMASLAAVRALGRELLELCSPGATLVHNAGIWPAQRVLTAEALEQAFVVNHLAPLALQAPLLERGLLSRVMVVGAGLMLKGRFDPERTPWGHDFSSIRTYCTTKLCFAMAMRRVAQQHPEVDVVVLHPGVVRTDLGARPGLVGGLLSVVKRGWETPEVCAARLARILARPRWAENGQAPWLVEEKQEPWPEVACDAQATQRLLELSERLLAPAY